LGKFAPKESTPSMLLGNVANLFLDELMNNPDADFKATFKKAFAANVIPFSLLDNDVVIDMRQRAQRHFATLRQLVKERFGERRIDREHCYLEPSFTAEKYGIQGRLDVLFREEGPEGRSAIIELKSNKEVYSANQYGVSQNHYVQTLLYDLLLRSVYGESVQPETYILYSALEKDQLKFVPKSVPQQKEAINVRNRLVALEWSLCQIDEGPLDERCLFDRLNTNAFRDSSRFTAEKLQRFEKIWNGADPIDRKYFRSFVGFTAREHRLARTGAQGNDQLNGLASLWLEPLENKSANFEALAHLRIESHEVSAERPTVTLRLTQRSARLTNFRKGDMAVLYPYDGQGSGPLDTQIFKCNIVELNAEKAVVKLRSQQFNQLIFENASLWWALEHDGMDSSFSAQYRGLFFLLEAPAPKRELLMGLRPPASSTATSSLRLDIEGMTEEQSRILAKALAAPEYFLLLGPPGTGKTQFMLKHYVKYLIENTDEQVLLLAYTNRAVDEICEAIHEFAQDRFLRLGSEGAATGRWKDFFLKNQVAGLESRKQVRELLDSHRIVVSTLSTMNGNLELLQLKKFNRVVLDEASQVLEPMLVGLLSRFERFVLIGDHKQLPAVVMQDKDSTAVHDPDLQRIGLFNRRNALFERLYRLAERNGWDGAYDMLSAQGRMHGDIAAYPGERFYGGTLQLLPNAEDAGAWQRQPLSLSLPPSADPLLTLIAAHRFLFLDTPVDTGESPKTNRHEAETVVKLVQAFQQLYRENQREWSPAKVGVITPYRAQIACIREALTKADSAFEQITVDTVERYQGGAREIILLSFCVNAPQQLENLVSLGEDEVVDRKLNVALTRARQHLVMVGNRAVLQQHPVYNHLLDSTFLFSAHP
jgi:DNA replication ATP-dependent helicase Dna2